MSALFQTLDTIHGALAYRTFGIGPGAPLVLCQRFRGTLDDWDPEFIGALARGRRVIVFDSAGIGRSGGEVPTTIAGMAEVTAAFVEGLGLATIDLLGWSLGGLVALQTALDHPAFVRRLIIAGSSPGGISEGPQQHPRVREVMTHPVNDEEDFLFLFFPETETARAAGRAHLRRLAGAPDRGPPVSGPSFMNQVKAFSAWPGVRERLKDLAIPVFAANGQRDVMIPAYRSYVLANEAPNGKLIVYPDAGHAFLFQYAADFAAEIDRFLT
jgi:pimeloyl-ACP methyl ester carboxylesterase